MPGGREGGREDEGPVETSRVRYRAVLSNPRFMVASVAIGFQSIARYGLLFWVPVHFLGADWKNSEEKWLSIALPVGMALGALTSGWLSDRLFRSRRSPVICGFMGLAAVASLAMFFIDREAHWTGMTVLFLCGFLVYGPQSVFWALCPDLLGPHRAGTGTGIMNTFAYAFAGLGEPFIGWMIESHKDQAGHDFTGLVFPIVAAACVLCAVTSMFIRR